MRREDSPQGTGEALAHAERSGAAWREGMSRRSLEPEIVSNAEGSYQWTCTREEQGESARVEGRCEQDPPERARALACGMKPSHGHVPG